jgi:hypothetical protein
MGQNSSEIEKDVNRSDSYVSDHLPKELLHHGKRNVIDMRYGKENKSALSSLSSKRSISSIHSTRKKRSSNSIRYGRCVNCTMLCIPKIRTRSNINYCSGDCYWSHVFRRHPNHSQNRNNRHQGMNNNKAGKRNNNEIAIR